MSRVLALSRKQRIYIPEDFKGEPNPPKFTIRSMTRTEYLEFQMEQADFFTEDDRIHMIELQDRIQARQKAEDAKEEETVETPKEEENSVDAFKDLWGAGRLLTKRHLSNRKTCLDILRDKEYLTGWENITVEEDEGTVALPFNFDNIDCLTDDIMTEICNDILGAVSGEDLGNSGNPSSVESGIETNQTTEKNGTAESVESQDTIATEIVNQ
jgi:hypothetical protein